MPSRQTLLQLDEPTGRVVHLTHDQAEPVPQEPEPLAAGPRAHLVQVPQLDGAIQVRDATLPRQAARHIAHCRLLRDWIVSGQLPVCARPWYLAAASAVAKAIGSNRREATDMEYPPGKQPSLDSPVRSAHSYGSDAPPK